MGSANVEKLFEMLNLDEELDVLTVSGWVMEMLGKIPSQGDVCDYANIHVTVLGMDGKRVEKVQVLVNPVEEE